MTEIIILIRPVIFLVQAESMQKEVFREKQAVLNEAATVFVFQDGWQKEMAW